LEFLFENPIILIAIIGMIASFLKRLKSTPNEDAPNKQQPEWKKVFDLPEMTYEELPKEEVKREYVAPPVKVATDLYHIEKAKEKTDSKVAISSEKIRDIIAEGEIKDEIEITPKKQQLVNGIVWSEILGPPRALKQHSHKRR
jgi:hypothetical protein